MRCGLSCVLWIAGLVVTSGVQPPQTPGAVTTPQPPPRAPAPPNAAPVRDSKPRAEGTARLRGRVSDDLGAPLARVWVAAHSSTSGLPTSTLTDADGRFELGTLVGGRHVLVASKPGYTSSEWTEGTPGRGRFFDLAEGQTLDRIEIVLRRGAVISGRVVDDTGAPVADVTVNALRRVFRRGRSRLEPAQRSATTDDRGEYRLWGLAEGAYFVSAESKAPAGPYAATSGTGYAPTFAPGTSAVSEAARITTIGGQDVNADIRLTLDKVVRIVGHVVLSSGEPAAGGLIRLIARGEMRREGPSGPIMDGGRFSLPDIPPGSYTLIAKTGFSSFPGPAGPRPVTPEIAVMPIEVGRDDLSGVRVVATRGIAASGVVVAQNGALPTHAPIRVQLVAVDPDEALGGAQLVSLDAAGRFTAGNVVGAMLVQPLLPRGWMVSSVTYDGADVTERPIELRADGGPLRVVITDRVTSISGTVTDDRGRPLTECEVLIFSEDAARWNSGARSIRHTRPAQNGSYRAEGMAPGRYHIVALRHLDEDAISDPTVLTTLRPHAESIELAVGQPQRLDLKLTTVAGGQ